MFAVQKAWKKGVIYSVNKRTHTINTRRLMQISTSNTAKISNFVSNINPRTGEILIVMSQPSTTLFKYNGVRLITINKNVNISIRDSESKLPCSRHCKSLNSD